IVTLGGEAKGIHTNGQWVRFTRTYSQSEFCACTPGPSCACETVGSCQTYCNQPVNPAYASLMADRFGSATSTGNVWVDDIGFSPCPADFDGNGVVTVADIFAFLSAWFGHVPGSDFDGANGVQVADIFAFLTAWFAGCPTP